MEASDSILAKLIESQEKQQAAQFNSRELVVDLLKNLSSKESDILSRRFGLLGKKSETLEQIGKQYNITRERIRQIESATIKKIKEIKDFQQHLTIAEQNISHILEKHGGIMEENHLLEEITNADKKEFDIHAKASRFILQNLLNDKVNQIKNDGDLLGGWKLPIVSLDVVKEAVNELVSIIEEQQALIEGASLLEQFKTRDFYRQYREKIAATRLGNELEEIDREVEKIVHAYLKISKKIDQNILGEWGLAHWNEIKPKRMSDKVYLILRQAKEPLHFTGITERINESNFDRKKAFPATIHNELILDDRYVLVGRGIYALKEWGYQSGTVIDIIENILKSAGKPLSKKEIVDEVLKQRIVRKSTIYLALTNKTKVQKLPNGTFTVTSA